LARDAQQASAVEAEGRRWNIGKGNGASPVVRSMVCVDASFAVVESALTAPTRDT